MLFKKEINFDAFIVFCKIRRKYLLKIFQISSFSYTRIFFSTFQISPKFRSSTPAPNFDDFDDVDTVPATPFAPVVLVSTTEGGSNSGYDPCAIPDSCGPNAVCTTRLSDPVCSCPSGFSGIPRDGIPDPSHGCVRTPTKCGLDSNPANSTCPNDQSCVRELCLPDCSTDSQCALGKFEIIK